MKFSTPYTIPTHGYWSPVTSTLDWCEEDYYATPYIAEIVNTLTNIVFVILASRGIINGIKHQHDKVFTVAYLTYMFIGIGSICFHATLKYEMQLLDELSMIYTACVLFYATFSFGKSRPIQNLVMVFSISLAIFISVYYHFLKDPEFHQNCFTIICLIIVSKSIYTMQKLLRPSRYAEKTVDGIKKTSGLTRIEKQNLKALKSMWQLVACGLSTVGLGFILWTVDQIFCSTLRSWRHQIGLPWGLLLEGHGWWHVFTGMGLYYHLVFGVYLRHHLKGDQDDIELVWPSIFTSIPAIVRKDRTSSTSNGNKRD